MAETKDLFVDKLSGFWVAFGDKSRSVAKPWTRANFFEMKRYKKCHIVDIVLDSEYEVSSKVFSRQLVNREIFRTRYIINICDDPSINHQIV